MRTAICFTLLFICLSVIPSVLSDRKYKVSEYDERDRRQTRERYNKRDDYKKKYRSNSDEDVSESDQWRRVRREEEEEEPVPTRASKKAPKQETRRNRISDEDYTDETDEDYSDVCVRGKGRRCESDDLTDETNEDYTDEDDSDVRRKPHVSYVKKFAHEKKKKQKDKEAGNILKIHRRAGLRNLDSDDDSSEEVVTVPKRRRYIYEDEE